VTAYAAEIESAAADIQDAGAPVTFSRGTGTYNDTTGNVSGGPLTASSFAISVKGKPIRDLPGGLVLNQPITLLVAAKQLGSFSPLPNDKMTWGGTTYTVAPYEGVDPVMPDGTAIMYRVTGSL
jgi:hypothetical protein